MAQHGSGLPTLKESQKISVPELKLLLEKSDPLVIDVRNASEIESSGSIASKRNINIPFIDLDEIHLTCQSIQQLQADTNLTYPCFLLQTSSDKELCLSNEDFKVKYGVNKPLPDGSDAIFHCMKGGRGSKAVVVAEKQGMEKARNLEGGYSLWSSQ